MRYEWLTIPTSRCKPHRRRFLWFQITSATKVHYFHVFTPFLDSIWIIRISVNLFCNSFASRVFFVVCPIYLDILLFWLCLFRLFSFPFVFLGFPPPPLLPETILPLNFQSVYIVLFDLISWLLLAPPSPHSIYSICFSPAHYFSFASSGFDYSKIA